MSDIEHAPGAIRMFRCLRCHRIGNTTSTVGGCDCTPARHEEVFLVPEQRLVEAAQERDAFARALRLAVASPELRKAYVTQAKDSLAREGGR